MDWTILLKSSASRDYACSRVIRSACPEGTHRLAERYGRRTRCGRVESSLAGWNADRAERESVVLLPWRWEKHGVPVLKESAQGVINSQAVDSSDIIIALFDARLGQETENAISGTAEEIERAHGEGRPVHVYFSDEPIPRDADLDQAAALREFRGSLEALGLVGTYANPADLGFKVRTAIEHDLGELGLGTPKARTKPRSARLRARYDTERIPNGVDNKGRPKYRDHRRLILQNRGDVAAESIELTLSAPEGNGFRFIGPEDPFDLLPDAERDWPLMPLNTREVTVSTVWSEDGTQYEENQTISV